MKEKFSLHQNFSLKTNDDGSKSIEGFAVHGDEGFIVNGFFEIPAEELNNCTRSLKGAKLMKDHDTDHVDSIIGRVNKAKKTFDEQANMEGVHYEASLVVDDTKLAEKIEKGLIDATSIGFTFEPECSICGNPFFSEECTHHPWFDDMHFICRDMDVHELSLVTFGADPHATVSGSFDAKELDKLKEKFAKEKEDFIMSKEDKMVETLKEENLKLSQEVKDLEAKLAKKETDFKEQENKLRLAQTEEVLTLKQEKDALEAQVTEMTEELSSFRAELEAQKEAEFNAKKERLLELAQALEMEHALPEEMDEKYIDEQLVIFEEFTEKSQTTKVPKYQGASQHHNELKEEGEHVPFSGVSKAFHIAHAKMQKGD